MIHSIWRQGVFAERGGTAKGQGQGGRRQDRAEREDKEVSMEEGGRKRAEGRRAEETEGGREEGGRSKDRSKEGGRSEGRRGPSRCRPGMTPGRAWAIFTGICEPKAAPAGPYGRSGGRKAQVGILASVHPPRISGKNCTGSLRRPNSAFESAQRTRPAKTRPRGDMKLRDGTAARGGCRRDDQVRGCGKKHNRLHLEDGPFFAYPNHVQATREIPMAVRHGGK